MLYIGFPFHNMDNGMAWNMKNDIGGMKFDNIMFWELGNSGVYFNNIPIFSPSPGEASIQLVIEETTLQEIEFEIVE
jgi:hypothetical protein